MSQPTNTGAVSFHKHVGAIHFASLGYCRLFNLPCSTDNDAEIRKVEAISDAYQLSKILDDDDRQQEVPLRTCLREFRWSPLLAIRPEWEGQKPCRPLTQPSQPPTFRYPQTALSILNACPTSGDRRCGDRPNHLTWHDDCFNNSYQPR